MKLVLRNSKGEAISVEVVPGDTFRALKTRLQEEKSIMLDLEQLKYKGKKITDDQVITQYFADDVYDIVDDAVDDSSLVHNLLDASSLMVVCSVPGCNNTGITSPEKTFFGFPTDTNSCQHWLLLCKRLDLLDKPCSYVSEQHQVCEDHFIADQLIPTTNGLKLKFGAIPALIEADYLMDATADENDEVIECQLTMPIKSEPDYDYSEDDEDVVSDVEDSSETRSHPGLLCRLCACDIGDMVETGEMVYIFSSTAKDQDVALKINMSLPVTVKSTDPLPKQLCMPCLEKLNMCHEFAETCLLAEKKLCTLNKEKVFKSRSTSENDPDRDDSHTVTGCEFKVENKALANTEMPGGVNKENADSYRCPLCRDGSMANPRDSKESEIIEEIQRMDGFINTYLENAEDGLFKDDARAGHETDAERPFGSSSDPLYRHRATHVEMKPFQCDKCGRCFSRKALFTQHTLAHLNDGVPKQQRTCKLCGLVVFGAYTKMLEHRRISHPGVEIKDEESTAVPSKPFKCEECGKSFAYRVTLVAHLRKHTGELPFDCQYCEKRFSQKRSLVLHERTHTGEKPYECETCGKRFSQTAHMYSHLRLHTGEKPYSCPNCPSTFRLKDVRDAHLRKHTGERPYKCGVCEKAFRTSHSYYQHMWIHQGKKPYPCEYCGKAFRRSNGLKIHIRIHTGEKPHCCEVCGRGFAQKQDMKKHLNLHLNGKL